MKEKLKSYEFWVSVISAVLVVLQTMSTKLDIPHVTEVMTAFLGALCVAGILKKTKAKDEDISQTADSREVKTDTLNDNDFQDEDQNDQSASNKDEQKTN
ncbi:MAG: hypothetical protein K2J89_00150 [Clostridia bacterium]|nr:hypothetical protein [Clostridia bacterium]